MRLRGTRISSASQGGGFRTSAGSFAAASSQYLSVASNANLQIGAFDFWLSFWFFKASAITNTTLISKSNGSSANREFVCRGSGNLTWAVNSAANTQAASLTVNNTGAVGSWIYLFIGYDSVANTLIGAANVDAIQSSSTLTGSPWVSTSAFNIGSEGGSNPWNGRVESVAFGKSPPGGFATTPAATIRDYYWNGGLGRKPPTTPSTEKTAFGYIDSWLNYAAASLTASDTGTNNLTNNNGVTVGAGVIKY